MGLNGFQGGVVDALVQQDFRNEELLTQVIEVANKIASNETLSDITQEDYDDIMAGGIDTGEREDLNNAGWLVWGGKTASMEGAGGVSLLEFAKNAIQTAVSNISGMGTQEMTVRKQVERKFQA